MQFTKGSSILNDFTGLEYWECSTDSYHYMIWQLPTDALGCPDHNCPVSYTPPDNAEYYYRLTIREESGDEGYTHIADSDTLEEAQRLAQKIGV